ncbi:MAG: DUF1266 domain-containing protein [Defluviitaleaceae bacterium]|nr:DUF1266 domain-containing protein [Defluviitaleaceae bacterium]
MTLSAFGPKAVMRFNIPKHKPAYAREVLAETWEITDGTQAVAKIEQLAEANTTCPAVREVFDHIIAKNQSDIIRGIFTPIKGDALLGLNLPQNFVHLWRAATNNANEDIDAFMIFLNNPNEQVPGRTFHNITQAAVLARINKSIAGYEQAVRSLIVFGYSREELAKLSNFSAWDLGRCGHVAKMSALAGYISEAAAWRHMIAAGDAAYKTYNNWREFLAAYFIGRGMAHTADGIADFGETIRFLLKDSKSPYRLFPLKSLEDDEVQE